MVGEQVRAWPGHERGESLEEDQRLEEDRAGAVAPSTPQPVDHAPVRLTREPLAGDGGAGDVPAQAFESGAVVTLDRDLRVQREALEVAAQLGGKEERPTVTLTTTPRQVLPVGRSERDAPLDRGGADEREQGFVGHGFVVLGVPLARQAAATLEIAHDPAVQERGDVRDVLVARLGRGLEAGRGQQTLIGVDAILDQRVEVVVEVQRSAEPSATRAVSCSSTVEPPPASELTPISRKKRTRPADYSVGRNRSTLARPAL